MIDIDRNRQRMQREMCRAMMAMHLDKQEAEFKDHTFGGPGSLHCPACKVQDSREQLIKIHWACLLDFYFQKNADDPNNPLLDEDTPDHLRLPKTEQYTEIKAIVKQLLWCEYSCEDGPLKNNLAMLSLAQTCDDCVYDYTDKDSCVSPCFKCFHHPALVNNHKVKA